MNNERGDLPSASNAHRYAACPGSHRACIGLPDTTSEDAARGDRIHAWLEGMANGTIPPPLAGPEEQDVAERCLWQSEKLIAQHVGLERDRLVESRIWDPSRTWSGKADLVVIDNRNTALVIDYKTGRGDVEEAVGNLQLRALAALVAIHYMVDVVTVAIVQPLAGPPSVCRYEAWDLLKAAAEIDEIMGKANATNQPRNPGPWCQYCRAAGTDRCPESQRNLPLPTSAPKLRPSCKPVAPCPGGRSSPAGSPRKSRTPSLSRAVSGCSTRTPRRRARRSFARSALARRSWKTRCAQSPARRARPWMRAWRPCWTVQPSRNCPRRHWRG
ncbi:MAG: DUF2800 domain-containing protein [Caulobacteraceae bacterium]|nr:DUF2800 domain-containing protein [Caulobacteraceae bacterium]